ncbi:autotransporter outer membrane beta-barrel domain-containing protein [Sphingomonas aurantiaca]|uniref:autotransporter outer membrane beta-barrel domain-containing protein n=1 Tax=Sphingomonas aurantiaca TaxID=185949 RepID=UPI00334D6495
MVGSMSSARRVRARALQTSALVMTLALAAPAFAQCAPDPTQTNGTTICSGTDVNGLVVTTYGTSVSVPTGATVLGGGQAGIAVQLPSTSGGSAVNVSVAGRVDGVAQSGVSVLWQPAANNQGYATANLLLTVAQGGTVTGANAVVVGQAGAGYGNAYATIDNAGTLTGTGGIALLSTTPNYAGFSSITNRATGTIGAISGPVGTLSNAGMIDGGSRSAVDWGAGYLLFGNVTNSGTITSASTTATLANLGSSRAVANTGLIANTGTGTALAGDFMMVTNAIGGRITSGGATAIQANTSLSLTNAGTITGNVVTAAQPAYTTNSTIDSTAGTITGSVTFGAGNDTLVAGWNGNGLVTGITGAINGGSGTDTVRVRIAADTTLANAAALPTAFEQLSIAPDANVTVTLADGFAAPGPLGIAGSGTIVNRTTLTGTTQAVVANDFFSSGYPTFINAGTIRTTAGTSGVFAAALGFNVNRFENSGTIAATGDGVSFSSQGEFVNSGTITAAGTGVSLFGPSFANSGTIRSTGGIGVILSGSYGSNWTNSGLIEGATAGARVSSTLVNTGTITSAETGVQISYYGVLDNRTGGVVTGGLAGIAGTSDSLFNATIANAGTINGNVRLIGNSGSSYSGNRYFALAGGVLNGSLTLGNGDTLISEFANDGAGAFAGITGTVTASGTLLRYRVRADAAAMLDRPAGFAGVGYDLYDGATLTLTGTATQSAPTFYAAPLSLAGNGIVDVDGTITATSQPAIQVTSLAIAPGETVPTMSGLAITSRGSLTLDHPNDATYAYAAVTLGGSDSFTNAGTITVRDRATTIYSPIYAIGGGKDVVNTGTITLAAAGGVSGARSFTNSGAIVQTGATASTAVISGVAAVTNTGTIDAAGTAILLSYGNSIVNSGRIASSGAAAIATSDYYTAYGATITNQAGGTIAGANGQAAIRISGGTLSNAGTITGSVDLGYSTYGQTYLPATYIANGGTLAGDLRFGAGDDVFVAVDDVNGVSGTIDGGEGTDTYTHARTTSGTVTLGALLPISFEREGVRALGTATVATIAAATPFAADVIVSGDGAIVNTAVLLGQVSTESPSFGQTSGSGRLASFTNSGSIALGFTGAADSFVNAGAIGTDALGGTAVAMYQDSPLTFANSGTIASNGSANTMYLGGPGISFANSGTITNSGTGLAASLFSYYGGTIAATNSGNLSGGFDASSYSYYGPDTETPATASVSLANSGTITRADGTAVELYVYPGAAAASVSLNNSGMIEATGADGVGAIATVAGYANDAAQTINVVNSGTIRATGSGGVALLLNSDASVTATVVNASAGLIEAMGANATALLSYDAGVDLTNAGVIRGNAGRTIEADDPFADYLGTTYVAGAIQTGGSADDRIVNTGSIIGSVALGAGNDAIENRGRIEGDVFLGSGDDSFLQLASATLIGTVDGGTGTDDLIVDATGGGAVNGDQFINFERFSQIGQGSVAYSGNFRFDTIGVSLGTVTVAAGETLTSNGPVTLTGSDSAETVINNGTIAGSVLLLGGNDRFVNAGQVGGAVSLGDGDDAFVEQAGSRVVGGVDGGAGNDLYTIVLAGDHAGLGARTGFERLGVTGSGTLSLTLDQGFDQIALAGTGLNLALAGYTVGAVTGSAATETLSVDGDFASVSLDAGDDSLTLGTTRATGRYDGGAGTDTLRFGALAPVTLAGTATGFEQVVLGGGALTVTGTLGTAGAALAFGAGDQRITVANGGTLAGTIDLGAGNDGFRLAAAGTLNGTVAGGAGTDTATIELAGNRTIGAVLTGFETLATEGAGTLSLTGTQAYDRVLASGDLTIAAGASLVAPQVVFAESNNRFTIAGTFAGSVDGGAGSDTIAVSGGSQTTPVAFGSVANVESFAMSGGFATVSGTAAFGAVDLTGGRLVGLAGSTIGASQIFVRQGATFGSAGTVNANLTVAGTLSPGASPGTITVNGNVALQSGSVSLFEITPTVSDKLLVNGTLTIASGATLQLAPSGTLRPGTSYDLIIASGGITGSYSTIVKPDTLFGFVVQRADRIQLLGQFLGDPAFSPQVSRSIAYANATLAAVPATSTLFNALPSLLTANGASNPVAFAQITPEAYASATQIGVDNALALSGVARGAAFGTAGDDTHAYTFAQTLGGWHRLGGDPATGTAMAQSRSYGFLGGIGVGNARWSVGGFAGYLNDRQQIDALGARTKLDGVVAGVHGRYLTPGGFGVTASVLYDGGKARTDRALPGAASANGRYDLHSWVSDVSVSYELDMASDWTLRPRAGVTYVRTTRDGVAETGGSPFALTVARDRHVAGFADAGLSFARPEVSTNPFRPFVSLGARYQIEGTRTDAVAGYAGGGLGLEALGAQRARLVGTAAAGIAYRLPSGLDLFSSVGSQTGRDDHQESLTAGLRLRF